MKSEAKELNKPIKLLGIIGLIAAVSVLLFVVIYGMVISIKYPTAGSLCREEVVYWFSEENNNDIAKIESKSREIDLSAYDNLGKHDRIASYEYTIYYEDESSKTEVWYAEIHYKVHWLAGSSVIKVYDLDVVKNHRENLKIQSLNFKSFSSPPTFL